MTALTHSRPDSRWRAFTTVELVGKVEQVYQGGRACFDSSTGLVAKAFASTTLTPIGTYVEDQLTASGQRVLITLDREVWARWFKNSTAGDLIITTDQGKDCYLLDDQTVAKTSGGGTRSVAGRVWDLDPVKGVLVQARGLLAI